LKILDELFAKYLDNQCSPVEVKALLAHFNLDENEETLRKLIMDSLGKFDNEGENSTWTPALDESFHLIKKQIGVGKAKIVPFWKKTAFRITAALVLVVGGYAVYDLGSANTKKQNIARVDSLTAKGEPGSNKALLTLGDGSTIALETAINGFLSFQGDSKITKAEPGELVYTKINSEATSIVTNSLTTPKGGQYQVILSDGTKVWLNAASSLRYPSAFAGSYRTVELTGEGYFEAAKNPARPFKVKFGSKGEVEVLGTHFNISSYDDEPDVNITLLQGKVRVKALSTGKSVIIDPGQQAQLYYDGVININRNADTEQAVAWANGAFNFNNADLGNVLRQLSRWYDLDIVYEGALPKRQFGGEIQRDLKLTQVLKILERNQVKCRLEGNKLTILK